jgi:N-acetylmuramoyl-L-alanine amidase
VKLRENHRLWRWAIAAGVTLIAVLAVVIEPRTLYAGDGTEAVVCFWSDQGPVCVPRQIEEADGGPDADALVESLLAGPTPYERAQGLWTAIPPGTTLDGVEVGADGTVVVRLRIGPETLGELDPAAFEIIVRQVGGTLEPLGWRDLRIQTWDLDAAAFVPLASFLPEITVPRKESVSGEAGLDGASAYVGQPPASGQGQPQGGLSGKTVYVSAGHGWEWWPDAYPDTSIYKWKTQRSPYPVGGYASPIIEDHNNAETVNQYLLQYLWNAGATVIPVRERDMNGTQAIVDNDGGGPGYSETGAWYTSIYPGYLDLSYRYTPSVVGAETATAQWATTLPADGQYAVYVWYLSGYGRVPDAVYTVHHAGGETPVTIDQRYHGSTWHYIGTYGFQAGQQARVTLSNQSAVAGAAVVADAVRFGGGTFDDLSGIDTTATYAPNEPWWEVATFYYAQRMGLDPDDMPYYNDVVARPMYARWEHAGTGDDAVYVSWHTNGYNGTARGTESYIHNMQPVPGSDRLQYWVHTELVSDIRAGWEAGWTDRGRKVANLGEMRELWDDDPAARIPGVLVEIAFHDNPLDTDALREPTFEMLAARGFYQGIVKYFAERDGVAPKLLPEPPTHLAVQNTGSGGLRVSWQPSPTDAVGLVGDAATGYRVYTSTNGVGWSNGVAVGATTVYTLTGFAPGQLVYVRVSGTNAGGESFPTEVLGARVRPDPGVLLINGFDRINRSMLIPETDPTEGYNVRMFLGQMNAYDYAVQHGETIPYGFDSASNEAVKSGTVSLGEYGIVDWIIGEESSGDDTLDGTEQALLESYLDGGGALFISGSEIGWDLDLYGSTSDELFYSTYLHADLAGDDSGVYQVTPSSGSSIFYGLASFYFDAPGMYDPNYPDRLTPVEGSVAALTYVGGTADTAAIQYNGGCERVVYFGFPFETIHPAQRAGVMDRTLGFLDECFVPSIETQIASPADGGAHNSLPAFGGTAETESPFTLDRVEVQVQRVDTGQYWRGGEWGTETWLTAGGTAAWSYTLPALPAEGDYRLRARAWVTGSGVETTPEQVTFTYDTVSPTATSLITPTGGVTITAPTVSMEWQPVGPDGGSPLAYVVRVDGTIVYTTTQSSLVYGGYLPNGPHTWAVQVIDAAGNRSGWVSGTFNTERYHFWLPILTRWSGQQ